MDHKAIPLPFGKTWHAIRSRPLIWDTITTTALSTIGRGVGFLIPFFIAAWFGVTSETDAFFFAYGLILFLSGIFAPVVESVIVPFIAEARAQGEDVGRFVSGILGISGIGLLVLAGLILLLVRPILSLVTRFDAQSLNLVYQLLMETLPLIILLVWTSILAGTLNAYKKFAFPALSPAFRAIINLGIIFILKDIFGVHAIAWGYVVGEAVRLVILMGVIKQLNLFKLGLSFRVNPKLREFLKTASYQTIGMVAVGLNPVVDKTMASWLGAGSVSALYYADRLYMIPVTFMTTGLIVTLLSHWSGRYYECGYQRLNEDVKKTVKLVISITLPIMLLLILTYRPIVKFAFGRGAFDQARLSEVGLVWVCYLLGFMPYIVGFPLSRAHLVIRNTKFLMEVFFVNFIINIFLNLFFMWYIGLSGISLSTSVVSWFSLFLLWKGFNKKIR